MREREGCGERKTGRMREDERGREYGWRREREEGEKVGGGGHFLGKMEDWG